MTARQLPLDLPARTALGVEDFLVAPGNESAVAWLDRWPDWPSPVLALIGPPGCGKTHLAHIFAERAGAAVTAASALDGPGVPLLLDGRRAAVVEDCGGAIDETALFHLLNLAKEDGKTLLLTAQAAPSRWPTALPDLRSRLAAVPIAAIAPPDDALIAAVLVKLAADRQLGMDEDVLTYLLRHMERSFLAAREVVARIDALAMQKGRRRVTVPLAREALSPPDRADG